MIIKTRIFELSDHKYKNLSELAHAMGISVSQIYRVKEGKRHINQKFIIGAIKAYPEYKLDDLFYLAPESPIVTRNYHLYTATPSAPSQAAKEEQTIERTHQVLERFTSAIDEYAQHLKSHTNALTSLRQTSEELKKSAQQTNKLLNQLYETYLIVATNPTAKAASSNLAHSLSLKPDLLGQYLPSSPGERVLVIKK